MKKYLIALPCFHGAKGFNHQTILVSAKNERDARAITRHLRPNANIGEIKHVNYQGETFMTALTTPTQISAYRLATLRTALKLEKLGMKMSRGPSALSILRGMGYKGKRDAILAQVTQDVADAIAAMEEGTVTQQAQA